MIKMRRPVWIGLLVLLLLLSSTAVVSAQAGVGDKVVMGGNYVLNSGETLNSGLVILGGSADLQSDSIVNGDVTVMGGTLTAAGRIHGDVAVFGGSVTVASTGVVQGSINTWGGSVHRATGSQVTGPTREGARGMAPIRPPVGSLPPSVTVVPSQLGHQGPFDFLLRLIGRFFSSLGMGLLLALIGLVVLVVAPRSTARVATAFGQQPAVNFVVGLLTLVLGLLLGIPLMLLCGLGLLVWLLALLSLLFGWIAAGLWLGKRLAAMLKLRFASSLTEALLGIFLITFLTWAAPRCVGWLFGVIVGCMGLGAVLLTRFGTQPSGAPADENAPQSPGGPLQPRSQLVPEDSEEYPSQQADGPLGPNPLSSDVASSITDPLASDAPDIAGPAEGTSILEPTPGASLEDIEAVRGVTPEIAARLRASGNTTLVALATSDPETLAAAAEVTVDRVREEDWIGQARRLLS